MEMDLLKLNKTTGFRPWYFFFLYIVWIDYSVLIYGTITGFYLTEIMTLYLGY